MTTGVQIGWRRVAYTKRSDVTPCLIVLQPMFIGLKKSVKPTLLDETISGWKEFLSLLPSDEKIKMLQQPKSQYRKISGFGNRQLILQYGVLADFAPHRTMPVRFRNKIACGIIFQTTWRFPKIFNQILGTAWTNMTASWGWKFFNLPRETLMEIYQTPNVPQFQTPKTNLKLA